MLLGADVLKPLSGDQGPGEAVPWEQAGEGHGRGQRGHADTMRPGIESLCSVGGRERVGKP